MRTLLIALLPATACQSAFVLDADPSCTFDVNTLDGGLVAHLSHADPTSGTFAYTSDRPLEGEVSGSYDLTTGAFYWSRAYDADSWIQTENVLSGVGTAFTDGDVDIAYTRQLLTTAGAQPAERVREVKLGCVVERDWSTLKGVPLRTERGMYDAHGYSYTLTRSLDGALVHTDGELDRTFTRTESESWHVGDTQYVGETVSTSDGRVVTTYDRLEVGHHVFGTEKLTLDGTRTFDYTDDGLSLSAEWFYTRDVRGNGGGDVEFKPRSTAPFTCEVTLKKGACTVSCPNQDPEGC